MKMKPLNIDETEIREIVLKILSSSKDPVSKTFFYAVFSKLDTESLEALEDMASMELLDRKWRNFDLPE